MEQLVRVTRGGQVTIPAALRREAGIEVGDYLEARLEDGRLVLLPKQVIDREQAYFWSKAWQEGEREAEQDLEEKRTTEFESLDDLFTDLDADLED